MLCGWGVKVGMVCVWVAGKTVWYPCYTRVVSERFEVVHHDKALYKFPLPYLTLLYGMARLTLYIFLLRHYIIHHWHRHFLTFVKDIFFVEYHCWQYIRGLGDSVLQCGWCLTPQYYNYKLLLELSLVSWWHRCPRGTRSYSPQVHFQTRGD